MHSLTNPDLLEILKRYPCIVSHVICQSLGYATPSCSARILKDAREGRENYCEWIYSCYAGDACRAVEDAIRNRHHHKGFMTEYKYARKLVDRAIKEGKEPVLASWL